MGGWVVSEFGKIVYGKNTPEKNTRGTINFQGTKSGAGEPVMLPNRKANARIEGVPFPPQTPV